MKTITLFTTLFFATSAAYADNEIFCSPASTQRIERWTAGFGAAGGGATAPFPLPWTIYEAQACGVNFTQYRTFVAGYPLNLCIITEWDATHPNPTGAGDTATFMAMTQDPSLFPVLPSLKRAAETWNNAAIWTDIGGTPTAVDASAFELALPGDANVTIKPGSQCPTTLIGGVVVSTNTSQANIAGVANEISFLEQGIFSPFDLAITLVGVETNPTSPNCGSITNADILFNPDVSWVEKHTALKTTLVSHAAPSTGMFASIEGVAAHEFGHAAGLAHSLVDSISVDKTQNEMPTMFDTGMPEPFGAAAIIANTPVFTSTCSFSTQFAAGIEPPITNFQPSPGVIGLYEATLQLDDLASIGKLYPTSGFNSSLGTISGTALIRPTGSGSLVSLAGAHVVAYDPVSPASRRVGSITDLNGSFAIEGLPVGNYVLRIEPVLHTSLAGSAYFPFFTMPNFFLPYSSAGVVFFGCAPTPRLFTPEMFNGNLQTTQTDPLVEPLLQEATTFAVGVGGAPLNHSVLFQVDGQPLAHPFDLILRVGINPANVGDFSPHGLRLVRNPGTTPQYPPATFEIIGTNGSAAFLLVHPKMGGTIVPGQQVDVASSLFAGPAGVMFPIIVPMTGVTATNCVVANPPPVAFENFLGALSGATIQSIAGMNLVAQGGIADCNGLLRLTNPVLIVVNP